MRGDNAVDFIDTLPIAGLSPLKVRGKARVAILAFYAMERPGWLPLVVAFRQTVCRIEIVASDPEFAQPVVPVDPAAVGLVLPTAGLSPLHT